MTALRLYTNDEVLPPTEDVTDASLVSSAREGSADAFRQLFERHQASVRRFLRDLLRDDEAARDACQETFARAQALLGRTQTEIRFKPWVLGIARNIAFEAWRVKVHVPYDTEAEDATPDAIIGSPDPESVLLNRELETQFNEALESLSVKRRAALIMRLDHGMSYEEIGKEFGWSLPTVKNEIHRARLKLRAALLPHLVEAQQ